MKGKFIKKLVAYALTAAMVVSTPMTAFASEFADNFWISDGVDENDPSSSGTGTVSASDTNTTVLNENSANIKGIKIKPASLVMNVGETHQLEAEILYEKEPEAKDKEIIESQLKWRSGNLSIVTVGARKGSMTVCPVTARKNGFTAVTAGLDLNNDGVDEIIARVNVMVKRNITDVEWKDLTNEGFYAGHTYDLHEYVLVNGTDSDASDNIAFVIKDADPKKEASVNGDGILTVSKSFKAADKEITVAAQVADETGKIIIDKETKLKISKGTPITKLAASNSKAEVNFSKAGKLVDPVADISVTMTPATNTDDITWTSSDEKIVKVAEKTDEKGNVIKGEAQLTGVAVGKTKVIATSTSGKKANFTVTVKADLISIDAVSINETNTTYSGKTTPVIVKRTPKQNTDKLKITVSDNAKKLVKVKNLNLIPAADLKLDSAPSLEATITVAPSDKKSTVSSKSATIIVKQSNVELKGVGRTAVKDEAGNVTNGATEIDYKKQERFNPSDRIITYYPILGACTEPTNPAEAAKTISWESSKETVATVDNGKLKVVGEGTAKITVSGVSLVKGKYKATKKTFTVKSTPKCEEIVLKSNTATVLAGKTATISVKQQLPKKAADPITWYVDGVKQTDTKNFTDKKATVTGKNPGDVIELLATTGSVSVEAKVYVVSAKVKKVGAEATLNGASDTKTTIDVGQMITISNVKADNGEPIVRYDIDKNGSSVVKVVPMTGGDGSKSGAVIFGIGKGKATVSAVSASGKSIKFKITVQ